MEPLTEQRKVPGPVVYGFVRLTRNAPAVRRQALADALTHYCDQHEVTLGGVFTERSDQPAAFTGLLDVLAMPDVYGVVIPARGHLGPTELAARRSQQLRLAGARLMFARARRTARSL